MLNSFLPPILSLLSLLITQTWAASLDRTGWTATAISSKTSDDIARMSPDGDIDTVGHTATASTITSAAHNITIDMKSLQPVNGISYLPGQTVGNGTGTLADYLVYLSRDGNNYTAVANGTFLNTKTMKAKYFDTTTAQYVKITVISGSSNPIRNVNAAEINVLSGPPNLRYNITVDSYESAQGNNPGTNAVDSDTSTIWHTQYSDPARAAPFPHWAKLDLGNSTYVNSFTYTPRQDRYSNGNGNIGQYDLSVSTDDIIYTIVSFGTFRDDSAVKTVQFSETLGRYVKLTAFTEAGNRGPWTSAAELDVGYNTAYVPSKADQMSTQGKWGPTISFPIIPVAAALLKNGALLTWSSWAPDTYQNAPASGDTLTVTSTYYPDKNIVTEQTVADTHHDMFCPGLSLDARGRPVVTGGNSGRENSIYDPSTGAWNAGFTMALQRGYQAQTTLSNGNIFIIGGSWTDGANGQGNKNGELYDPLANTMSMLSGCPVAPMLTKDSAGVFRQDNHGWLFSWTDSTVFQAGPSVAMNWYSTTQNGTQTPAGTRTGDGDAMNGNAAMFDVGRILTVGGSPNYQDSAATANAHLITITTPNRPANVTTIAPMNYPRSFANAVVLPDGKVLIVGGQSYAVPFSDDTAILVPELFDPSTNLFTPMAPHSTPRTYHSFALLMPDASVIHGGGGLCGGCGTNHFDAEIFYPPYLFSTDGSRATQPKILSTSTSAVRVGGSITLTMDSVVKAFSFVRMGSATHTINTDQRRVSLLMEGGNGNLYTVKLPSDAGVLVPGYWMLFGLNAAGVPSKAETVLVMV